MCESRNIHENIVSIMLIVVVSEQSGMWGIEPYECESANARVIYLLPVRQ